MIGNLLGLACRARKTVCGDFAAENYLKKHAVPLLFVASDGGENAEKYRRIAARRNIVVVDIYTKEELGRTVGVMAPQDAMAGLMTGRMILVKMPKSEHPSILAASTSSSGTSVIYWFM